MRAVTLLTHVPPQHGRKKKIITLKVKENITFKEARKRVSSVHKPGYSVVVKKGVASQWTSVPAQATCNEAEAGPRMPPAPPNRAARTPGSAVLKASPPIARSNTNISMPSARSSRVCEETVDTTSHGSSAPSTSEGRQNSLEHAKKDKPRITGPKT